MRMVSPALRQGRARGPTIVESFMHRLATTVAMATALRPFYLTLRGRGPRLVDPGHRFRLLPREFITLPRHLGQVLLAIV